MQVQKSKILLPVDVAVSKDTTGWLYFFTRERRKKRLKLSRLHFLCNKPAEEGLFDLPERQVLC